MNLREFQCNNSGYVPREVVFKMPALEPERPYRIPIPGIRDQTYSKQPVDEVLDPTLAELIIDYQKLSKGISIATPVCRREFLAARLKEPGLVDISCSDTPCYTGWFYISLPDGRVGIYGKRNRQDIYGVDSMIGFEHSPYYLLSSQEAAYINHLLQDRPLEVHEIEKLRQTPEEDDHPEYQRLQRLDPWSFSNEAHQVIDQFWDTLRPVNDIEESKGLVCEQFLFRLRLIDCVTHELYRDIFSQAEDVVKTLGKPLLHLGGNSFLVKIKSRHGKPYLKPILVPPDIEDDTIEAFKQQVRDRNSLLSTDDLASLFRTYFVRNS